MNIQNRMFEACSTILYMFRVIQIAVGLFSAQTSMHTGALGVTNMAFSLKWEPGVEYNRMDLIPQGWENLHAIYQDTTGGGCVCM